MTTHTSAHPLTMDEVTEIVDMYLSGWNEADPTERLEIIEAAWEPDCRLVDPPLEGRHHDGVNMMVEALQAHYPDHRFHRVSDVEHHHDAFRVDWELRAPDGRVALAGTDVGTLGPTGRVARVTGFFDTEVVA